jgi:hypothetical protein
MLFALLYNAPVEISFPKVDILRASDGIWVIPYYMQLENATDLETSFGDVFIVGETSGARGYVVDFDFTEFPENSGSDMWLAVVTQVSGIFLDGEVLLNERTGEVVDTLILAQEQPGMFFGESGLLSGSNKMQNDRKYQDFAYVLKSNISTSIYNETVDKLVHPAGFVRVDELRTEPDKELDNIGPYIVQILWHILFPEEELVGGTSSISGDGWQLSRIEFHGSTHGSTYLEVELGREENLQLAAYWSQNDDFDEIIVDDFKLYPELPFPYEPGFREHTAS